jgi:hypothetical protein
MGGAPASNELTIASPKKSWESNQNLLLSLIVHVSFVYIISPYFLKF